jgi:hypothetical protein
MWQAAFSSKRVFMKSNPLDAIGDECGTNATSPSFRAPSSVSIIRCKTWLPRAA